MKELDKRNVEYPDIQAGMYFVDTEGKIYFYQDNSEVPVKLNANGYKFVTLKRKVDLKKIRIPVHRIVAHTFIPKSLQDKLYDRDKVHFIDFDKNNTSVKNLEWINDKELNILSEIHKKGLTKIEDMEPYVKQLICDLYDDEAILKVFHVTKFLQKRQWMKLIKKIRKS